MGSIWHAHFQVALRPCLHTIRSAIKPWCWAYFPHTHRSYQLKRHYQYDALKRSEFRLLRGSRQSDGSLHVELQTFPLGTPNTPPFCAVSYVWGSTKFRNYVQVDAKRIPIPDSLHSFFHRTLVDGTSSWWWADSVCIDQSNDLEKAQQVSLMREIFESAETTCVWLGEQSEDSDAALEFLQYLGDGFWRELDACASVEYPSWITALVSRTEAYRTQWVAVERLFQRPWYVLLRCVQKNQHALTSIRWRRVWTVQEYIVSKSIAFQCGDRSLAGQMFNKALSAIWACHRATGTFRYDSQWNRNRILEFYHLYLPPSLTALLAYLGNHFSTDPRDRLYSLSGLARDPDILGDLNYDHTVAEVYTALVKKFVEKYSSLDIICFATTFTSSDGSGSGGAIPSWVPDWSAPTTPLVVPLMVSQGGRDHIGNLRPHWAQRHSVEYAASLIRGPEVFFSPDLHEMTCKGIYLDFVDGLTQVSSREGPRTNEQRENDTLLQPTSSSRSLGQVSPHLFVGSISKLVDSVVRCLVLDRKDHYMNHAAPKLRFTSELRALVDSATSRDVEPYTHFTAWYHANKSFRINGVELAALFKQTFSTRIFSAHELPEPSYRVDISERQLFASRFHDITVKMARRLVITENGLLAMAPRRCQRGDVICILYGCSVPVVLRKHQEKDHYQFIGECYVDGYMNGEALTDDSGFTETTFTLV